MLFAQDGGIFNFGNVGFHGSIYSYNLGSAEAWSGHPWVGGAVTSDKGGYWAVTSNEAVCAFGDAAADTYPSTGQSFLANGCWTNPKLTDTPLNAPIVGVASAGAGISVSTTPCASDVTSPCGRPDRRR